ncbi:unnamed protein product, partial [Didymodactylos carnosus]
FHAYFDILGYSVLSDKEKTSTEHDLKTIVNNGSLFDMLSPSPSNINNSTPTSQEGTVEVTTTMTTCKTDKRKPLSALNLFLASVGQTVNTKDTYKPKAKGLTLMEEMKNYKSLVSLFHTKDIFTSSSSVAFWKSYEEQLPVLAKYAKKYLAVPSMSVPSESAFSLSAYLARKTRARLSDDNLAYSVFLKDKIVWMMNNKLLL